jgi:hypothetical protein
VSELADRAHVSKPTVVRFCRSVGYDGLADFKRKLAGSVSEGVPFIHRSVDADDKTGDVMVKVIDNTVAAFLKYRNEASSVRHRKGRRGAGQAWKNGTAHRVFWRGQLRRRGAGRAAQVLPPGRQHHRLQRRPHAGDERVHAGPGRLRGGDQQLGPHPRPDGRLRHRAQERRHHHRHHRQRLTLASAGHIHLAPTTRRATTATAPWCRACCT